MVDAGVDELARAITSQAFQPFVSTELEAAVEFTTGEFRTNTMRLTDSRSRFALKVEAGAVGETAVARLWTGESVVTQSEPLGTDYLVSVPVSGHAIVRYGGREVVTTPGRVYVVGAYDRMSARRGDGYDQIFLRVPARRLESIAAQISGRVGAPGFRAPLTDWAVPSGWTKMVAGALMLPHESGASPLGHRLESILVESLLLSGSEPLGLASPPERVRAAAILRRAKDYMLADISRPPSLVEVAAHCGVSVRTIQSVFRSQLGETPTAWLRRERLQRTRAVLLTRDPGSRSITDVAVAHGFVHMGDFAAQFKAEFGMSPSTATRQ